MQFSVQKSPKAAVNPGIQKENAKVVDSFDVEDIGEKAAFCRCWRSKKVRCFLLCICLTFEPDGQFSYIHPNTLLSESLMYSLQILLPSWLIFTACMVILSCDGPWSLYTKILFYPRDVIKVKRNSTVVCKSKKESKCAVVVD